MTLRTRARKDSSWKRSADRTPIHRWTGSDKLARSESRVLSNMRQENSEEMFRERRTRDRRKIEFEISESWKFEEYADRFLAVDPDERENQTRRSSHWLRATEKLSEALPSFDCPRKILTWCHRPFDRQRVSTSIDPLPYFTSPSRRIVLPPVRETRRKFR
jgi:hypothetical protein